MSVNGAPLSNIVRNFRQIGDSPACWLWAGMVLGIQVLVSVMGGQDRQPVWGWFEILGLSRTGFLAGGIWQIFTYGFLHGGWWHVGVNSLFVLLIGSRIEHMVGSAIMVKAVAAGVVGGGIGHLLLAAGGATAPLLVGLSGGCFSLLLLLTTLSPQSRMMPIPISGRNLGSGILMAELLLALMDPALAFPGFSIAGKALAEHGWESWFQMGHACHFGGGMAGWILGRWLLRPRITLKRLRRDRERREAKESGRID